MSNNDLDEQIDELVVRAEKVISETEIFLKQQPEYAPRSKRSRKLQRKVGKKP